MANHLRRQIREAAAAALTGLATTGARVFVMRDYPLQDAELPGLLVFVEDESAARVTFPRPSIFERHMQLVVVGYAKSISTLDETLDAIAKEVEVAIAADPTFGGKAKETTLQRTELGSEKGAEQTPGFVRLTFDCLYFAREDAPDVAY